MQHEEGRGLMLLGLALSLVITMIPGLELAFNVYALSLKETFNFTQTQVEITGSMGTCGMAFTFLENMMSSNFGYKTTLLLTWVATSLTSGLVSLAAVYATFFHDWPSLIYLLQFLFSTTNCVAWMVITRINLENFSKKHSGKIVGAMFAMVCAGKIVFGLALEFFFEESLAGFFLTVSVSSACLYGVTFAVLWKTISRKGSLAEPQHQTIYLKENHEKSAQFHSINKCYRSLDKSLTDKEEETSTDADALGVSVKDMLRSVFFHVMFWSSSLFLACAYTFLNNVTSVAQSEGLHNTMVTVYVVSAAIMFTRISFGFIFDKFASLTCGFTLLMISYVSLGVASGMGLFALDVTALYVFAILVGVGLGPSLSISISVLLLRFGQEHFSLVSSLLLPVLAVFLASLQVFTGLAYDAAVTAEDKGIRYCRGKECFFWSFLVMSLVTGTVVLVQGFNCFLYYLNQKKSYLRFK